MNKHNTHQKINIVSLNYLQKILKIERDKLREIANTAGRNYKPFDLHKKDSKKWRHIDNPQSELKDIQKKILKRILQKGIHLLPEGMNGGISGKSVVDNAKVHTGKECIGIIDIKDCFPNTNNLKIYQVWRNFFGCGTKTAGILTKLTTFQCRLPQGAPSSPLLCNYVLTPIFINIHNYAKKHSLDVTMFIDDITISGKKQEVEKAVGYIIKVLQKNGYAVRKRKVRVIISGFSQKVTGVTINTVASVNRSKIQQIRNLIIETAQLKEYIPSDKLSRIRGLMSFVKSVSPSQGEKIDVLAESVLIKPILQVTVGKNEQTRTCRKFHRDHSYHPQ